MQPDLFQRQAFRAVMDDVAEPVRASYPPLRSAEDLWIDLRRQLTEISIVARVGGIKRSPQAVLKELAALAALAERGAADLGLLEGPPSTNPNGG